MIKKLLVIALCLGLLGVLAAGGLFFYVDAQVAHRVQSRTSSEAGAVYSTPLKINGGQKLSQDWFRKELLARQYVETPVTPTKPGEFQVQGARFELYTQPFSDGFGQAHPARLVRADAASGALADDGGRELEELLLEPQAISALGGGSMRASKYQPLAEIPALLQKAVITIEDERFYDHSGIDLVGIARALFANLKAGRIIQGGSTLTQQLAKNLLFTPRRTLGRKILEAFAALSLERRMSKDQILEMYLNEVYLGQEGSVAIHGVAEAALVFFDKKLEALTLSEAAMLAGLIRAPSYYSPRRHFERALHRREVVLKKMLENGVIDAEAFSRAVPMKPRVAQEPRYAPLAPHFQVALMRDLNQYFSVDAAMFAGVRIHTGLDMTLQRCAAQAVDKGLRELETRYPALVRRENPLEGALLAIEPYSGLVRAWAGGRDYTQNQYDHVDQGKRQMGSTVKPFLYLTALDKNLNEYKVATADMILPDRPLTFQLPGKKTWAPEDYDHQYRGDVTLRYALENSLNIPAAYVGSRVGVPAMAKTLKRFHLADTLPEVPAITLGAVDASLLRVTAAFGALANGGIYTTPRLFTSVVDAAGETLAETALQEERAADENAVYVLTNLLQGVIERGTAHGVRRLGFTRPAAGKTGTSDDARDAWFIGYVPNLVAGVWVGFDDNAKIGLTGGAAAVPIWTQFMNCAESRVAQDTFIPPPGVVFVTIDSNTHRRATAETPPEAAIKEVYVRGTEPPESVEPAAVAAGIPPDGMQEVSAPQPRRRRSFWDILTGE